MVLVASGGGAYAVTRRTHVAEPIVVPAAARATAAAASAGPDAAAAAPGRPRRLRRRSSDDPLSWAGLAREHDEAWWQTGRSAAATPSSRHGSSRRALRGGRGDQLASFYEPEVVEVFKRKTARSVSPFSHGVEWKQHREQSAEVQLVRRAMSPRAEGERTERAASTAGAFYSPGVVTTFLKHRKPVLPKLRPAAALPAPEPEPEPEPAPQPNVQIVARHGNYLPEPRRPASPPAVVQKAFVPSDEMDEEARARKALEVLLRKLFRMCDYRGAGLVTAADMANMDWLISEATGHPTILSTTERAEQIREHQRHDDEGPSLGISVGEFIYAKLEDIKARQPWWADLEQQYSTASDELRRAFALIDDIKEQQVRAKQELEELWALAWDLCDADADGSVTLEECIEIDRKLAASAGRPFSAPKCAKKFEQAATSEAGHISLETYVQVQLAQTQPPEYIKMAKDLRENIQHCIAVHKRQQKFRVELVGLFKKVFTFCDWQRDGMVSQDECVSLDRQIWVAMRRDPESFDAATSVQCWKDMDTDGNGGVDEAEFVAGQMKPIEPPSYEPCCAAVAVVLVDIKEARIRGHQQLEDLLERAFKSFDWSGTGILAADVAQRLDSELHELPILHQFFTKERVEISALGLQVAELTNRIAAGALSAAEEKKLQRQLTKLESDYTPFDAADFVHERLGALPPDVYHDAVAELDPCVRAMEAARIRQEEYHAKLLDLFAFAFDICDTGGDGEVSMQECILLDRQIAQVLGEPFDEEKCQHAWRDMDANNDGTVSHDEYIAFQMRNFGPTTYEEAYDGISYVMDAVDEMRSLPPCDGIITLSVRCQDLAFPGARRDSRVRVSTADAVFASEVQASADSPVYPESFRFPVVGGEPCKVRLEVLGSSNDTLGEVAGSIKCGRMLGGEWMSTVPVRRQFDLSRIGRSMGQTIVSMLFTSTATLRPPGPGALVVSLVECQKLIAADSNGLSDPYCTLSLGTQPPQRSVMRPKTLNPEFNQDFAFRISGDGKADDYRLSITVTDSNKVSSDLDIGTLAVDIGSLLGDGWTEASHPHTLALEHTKNTSGKSKTSAGTIKLILKFIPEAALRPPSDGVLTVTIVKCQQLVAADTNGLSDPYCELQVGKSKQKTRTIKRTLNPEFAVSLKFDIYASRRSNPFSDYALRIKVLDKDVIGSDDLLGTSDLLIGSLLGVGWSDSSTATHKLCPLGTMQLNLSFVDAALLRPPCAGLLLVSLIRATNVVPADDNGLSDPFANINLGNHPPFKSRKIPKTLDPYWRDEYRFPVEFDATLEQYRLHVQLKDHDIMVNDSLGRIALDVGPALGIDWAVPADEHIIPINDPTGEVSDSALSGRANVEHKYGRLHLGLEFIKEDILRPECDGLLIVKLIRAVDLVVADNSGSSDPYAQLRLGSSEKPYRSRTLPKQLNPVWGGDDFRFLVKKEGEFADWRLLLELMDHDKIGKNDHLGSLELDIGCVLRGKQWSNGHKPALYSLGDRSGNVSSSATEDRHSLEHPWGRVELSLSFVPLSMLKPPEAGLLIVKLFQCMDLPAADSNGQSDSFVTIALGSSDGQKSRVFEKERDPVWGGDEFRFDVVRAKDGEPADWRLQICAMDHDTIGRNDHLGALELDLGPATKWKRDCDKNVYALRDREGNVSSSSIQGREGLEYPWGRVELSLSFLPISHLQPSGAGLLKVTLIRGTSLLAADRNGQSDPFVMFTLGASPAQKSRVLKKTVNPVWNSKQDDFLWTVTSKQLLCSDWSLHVQCLDYDMMGSNESLGHLSLDIGLLLGKGWLGRASRRKGGGEAHGEFALRNDGKISASALKRRGGPELESLGLGTLELSLSYTVQG